MSLKGKKPSKCVFYTGIGIAVIVWIGIMTGVIIVSIEQAKIFRIGSLTLKYYDVSEITLANVSLKSDNSFKNDTLKYVSISDIMGNVNNTAYFKKPIHLTFSPPEKYTIPTCTFCNTKTYSFAIQNLCLYITHNDYQWDQCFEMCQNLHNCTYFYAPNEKTLEPILKNLKHGSSVWTGIYKLGNSDIWTSLNKNESYNIWDEYGTYCVELSGRFPKPRSKANCHYKKPCLCASQKNE